ncbi:MAG: tetratricopeptide repeat protein, partial [Rhodospirillales bacterium]
MPGRIILLAVLLGWPGLAPASYDCRYADWRDAPLAELQACSDRGHGQAMFWLGRRLEAGNVTMESPERAADQYRLALADGVAEAGFRLGRLYETGSGVAEDRATAAALYLEAAATGLSDAQYHYARLRDEARGADKDRVTAAHWYRRAALQGHAPAQYRLGLLHA